MKYKQLGNSGLLVTDLCLGTMTFGETSGRGANESDSIKMIHRFLDAGGNHLDTADVYAGGVSEKIVGKALKEKRKEVILATKVNFPVHKGINNKGLSRHHIMDGVHESLGRLDTDYIDLLYLHCEDPVTPLEETLRALDDLVTTGKIRYIGVSNFKAWRMMKALAVSDSKGWSRFIAAQYQYSLVKRDIEYEFTELCKTEGVGLTPWGPLGGGFLSGKYKRENKPKDYTEGRIGGMPDHTEEAWDRRNTDRNWAIIDAVGKIAEERGVTYSQIALAWVKAQAGVASVIIGVRNMQQLDDNLKTSEIELTAEELDKLDKVSQPPEMYPYRMIEAYGRKLP
ncbi:MAG: aldo/keto reductase [Bacteroidota bacterium]